MIENYSYRWINLVLAIYIYMIVSLGSEYNKIILWDFSIKIAMGSLLPIEDFSLL